MQSIVHALESRELGNTASLIKRVRELKAATLELSQDPDPTLINQGLMDLSKRRMIYL